jgi:tetratricopeptide (TPR) repeat protein
VGLEVGSDWFAFARSLCVRALLRGGRADEAATKVMEGLEHQPGAWRLLAALVDVAADDDSPLDKEQVLERVDEARGQAPEDIDLIDVTARAREELVSPEAARTTLHAALKARPDDPQLLMLLARFLERQDDVRGALSLANRLLERERPALDLLNFTSFTLADHSLEPERALRLAWRAVMRGPLNGYVIDTLGWAQFRAGQPEAARASLERADRLSPGEAEILMHLAIVRRALGDVPGALESARAAAARPTDDDDLRRRIENLVAELSKESA